ncbi:MAG TPA: peroxidase-related enzyme [Acidimicrobiia bacterium]|nr:peroxidase-related enzyme [Acidimicrobiia bacterium]
MFIEPVADDAAEGLTAEVYEPEKERWGFLPGFVQLFSHHPEAYRAWLELVGTVYGGMDRRRCELATLAATRVLRSTCCAIAHGKFLRDHFYPTEHVVRIAVDHHDAGLDAVDVAIMDFAEKVASDPAGTTEDDVAHLRELGLSDREIFNVALAVAARAFFATLIESLGTRAEKPLVDSLEPELRGALTVGRSV